MTEIRQNGSDELAVKAAVEHHVSSYQRVVAERDELQRQADRQEQMLTVAKIEIEGLRSELAAERSRTGSYQTERDQAVTEHAKDAVLIDIIWDAIKTRKAQKPPETLG